MKIIILTKRVFNFNLYSEATKLMENLVRYGFKAKLAMVRADEYSHKMSYRVEFYATDREYRIVKTIF